MKWIRGQKVDGDSHVALVIGIAIIIPPHFEQPSVECPTLYSKARPQKRLCARKNLSSWPFFPRGLMDLWQRYQRRRNTMKVTLEAAFL